MSEHPVKVYIYDLSKGLARSLSRPLLGKQLDGIWHTGIVVYNKEFYFGGMGIENCPPSGTMLGEPDSIVDLGTSQIPEDMFKDYLQDLSNSTFRPECYHLFDHNCNTFSNEVAQFLTGNTIPAYVTDMPKEVLDTPFGAMIKPVLDQMQVSPGGGSQMFQPDPTPPPPSGATASATSSAGASDQLEAAGKVLAAKVTMVTYNEEQILTQFGSLKPNLGELSASNDESLLTEAAEYLSTENCLWGLSPEHLRAIERTIDHTALSESHRGAVLGLLQQAVLKEDVLCLLKADRKHGLMTLLHHIESRPTLLQRTLAKTLCNCVASDAGYEWCIENTDWTVNSSNMTNLKVTLRTCVNCLLTEDLQVMEAGAGVATNLTNRKDVGDIYMELGSALIQALSKGVEQPTCTERCLQSLLRCMEVTEVTALARVMGLEVKGYSSTNPRCADLVKKIQLKLDTLTL